jgi:hypothetical protein
VQEDGKRGSKGVIDGIKKLTESVSGAVNAFNEMRKEAADVEQLKVVLGDSEFDNVKRTIGSIMAKNREEKRAIENKAREEQKKLTKEVLHATRADKTAELPMFGKESFVPS